ncbi:FAD-dependent oxidoreductase [Agarivorans sp. Toyoura001]|uniref:NAD(P)/FAD-dependent oxidoreductase n=1 Tax=Agarivorans sp. Toyoura001 TaxID=2283141 RepID=UPI0010D429C3|nr:FAD-binding oxidoreductase [Agarivorans sp. Toyoura001]GDY25192.1 FAD-dependent oxidoreductase [Agarivorans sp. Toyoura001]
MKAQHANSYYAASANLQLDYPQLKGDQQADVCVVGAGITGATTALELASKGYKVILLEGEGAGWGASGRSGGQAIFGWASEQSTLEKLMGKDDAKKMWDLSVEALAVTKANINKHKIDCDWQDGQIHVAIKDRHVTELKAWHEQLSTDYGYDQLEYWNRDKLESQLSSPRYLGGMFDPNSGHLHPLNYTLGLVKAAELAGAEIYEDSKVTKIEHGSKVSVTTASGSVTCSHVVLACNAYMEGLNSKLESRVMPVGTYICATKPLGEQRIRELIANNMAVCDINFVLDYYRCSGDHRMLFGGRVSYSGIEPRDLAKTMKQRMDWVFPQLADEQVEFAWGGNVGITINRAPHFGRIAPNVYFAQGFSGHGIAATGLAGQLMAESIMATSERFDIFEKIPHMPFPGGRLLRTPALVLAMSYYRLRDLL